MNAKMTFVLLLALLPAGASWAADPPQTSPEKADPRGVLPPSLRSLPAPLQAKILKVRQQHLALLKKLVAAKAAVASAGTDEQKRQAAQAAAKAQAEVEASIKRQQATAREVAAAVAKGKGKAKGDDPQTKTPTRTAPSRATPSRQVQAAYARAISSGVPLKVATQDKQVRFVVFLPGGPLIVQAALTLNGKPFREAREELVSQMLRDADLNQDGEVGWDEAFRSPRFTMGRVPAVNEQQKQVYLRLFDLNGDRKVDRFEARMMLAQLFQGPTFGLTGAGVRSMRLPAVAASPTSPGTAGDGAARKLLDTNEDGELSAAEVAAATVRLKGRDSDDNDLLELQELSDQMPSPYRLVAQAYRMPQVETAAYLGNVLNVGIVHQRLLRYYGDDNRVKSGAFVSAKKTFQRLDRDKDGELDIYETARINALPPGLNVEVDLITTAVEKGRQSRLRLVSAAPHLGEVRQEGNTIHLSLPGAEFSLGVQTQVTPPVDYKRLARSYLLRWDKEGKGYLKESDLPLTSARQFPRWDADGDGMVPEAELAESMRRPIAAMATRTRASIASRTSPVFDALDQSGDGRLSLREMRNAAARLRQLDRNGDGRISAAEVPTRMQVTFTAGISRVASPVLASPDGRSSRGSQGPAWFVHMDRNGDGDLTLKEFLGAKPDFAKLDANGDGFIDLQEARAAKQAAEEPGLQPPVEDLN